MEKFTLERPGKGMSMVCCRLPRQRFRWSAPQNCCRPDLDEHHEHDEGRECSFHERRRQRPRGRRLRDENGRSCHLRSRATTDLRIFWDALTPSFIHKAKNLSYFAPNGGTAAAD